MFRVMRLEIARLKSQISVSHAVRFGKSVIRKLGHQREYLLGLVLLDAPLHRTQNELLLLPRHLFTVLLAHRFAQTVGFRHRITSELLSQLHRLFLVDDYSVRAIENLLHFRNDVADAFLSMMPEDEIVNHSSVNRSGSIQGVKRRQIL